MSILLEDKIKERLQDLATVKARYVIQFNYGYVEVEDYEKIQEKEDLSVSQIDDLQEEIDELKEEVDRLEDLLRDNGIEF